MLTDRRLEYDKGPSLEDEEPADPADDADGPGAPSRMSLILDDLPWKAGSVAGFGAFAIVYVVTFQLVNAVYGSLTMVSEIEIGPGTIAGIVTLISHGARLEQGGGRFRYGIDVLFLFAPLLVALVALLVLFTTGYALVRYVGPETARETAITAAAIVPGYALAAVGTALLATHEPGSSAEAARQNTGVEAESLAVAVDSTFVLAFALVPLFAALAGAAAANRALLFETATETEADDDDRPVGTESASSENESIRGR